jgi:hypothetical protein
LAKEIIKEMNIRYILLIIITSFHISSYGQAVDSLHFTQEQYNQLVNRLNEHQDRINLGHTLMASAIVGGALNNLIAFRRINRLNNNQSTNLSDFERSDKLDNISSQQGLFNFIFGSLFLTGVVIPIKNKSKMNRNNKVESIDLNINQEPILSNDIEWNFFVGDNVKYKLIDDPTEYYGTLKKVNDTSIVISYNGKTKVIYLSKLASISEN